MKNKFLKISVWVISFLVILLIVISTYSYYLTADTEEFSLSEKTTQNISRIQLQQAIEFASSFMYDQVEPSGRLIYRRKFGDEKFRTSKYNLLRHAGTVYSLYLYDNIYQQASSNSQKRFFKIRKNLISYMKKNYIKPMKNMYGMVSKKSEEGISVTKVKLGGLGLGLVAMAGYAEDSGSVSDQDKKIMNGLAEFILLLQNNDGSFTSAFNWEKKEKDYSTNSLYYPGEASLGLIFLYMFDKNPRWLEAGKKALSYLATTRKDQKKVPFDHWALIATDKLFESGVELSTKEKKLLVEHAIKIVSSVLDKQISRGKRRGAFENNDRPCSLGTYVEGFVATINLIKRSGINARDLGMNESDLDLWILGLKNITQNTVDYLYRVQVKKEDDSSFMLGAIPTVGEWRSLIKAGKQVVSQIDNNQHVISGWIGWDKLVGE